jgi:hypothetical protein
MLVLDSGLIKKAGFLLFKNGHACLKINEKRQNGVEKDEKRWRFL